MDQPEKVNMTAEEEVDDDEDMPDFRTFKLNTEDAHLFIDQGNGNAHYSLIEMVKTEQGLLYYYILRYDFVL